MRDGVRDWVGEGEGVHTIHEVGDVDEIVSILGKAVGEEATIGGLPAEEVGDDDEDALGGAVGRGDVGV